MSYSTLLSQYSLAAAILTSSIGTYAALSPPNPNPNSKLIPPTGDTMRWLKLTTTHATKIAFAPLGFLALHTIGLAYFYPNIPSFVLRHGAVNGLNPDLVTWSAATSIPLALLLCGIPLRLRSYSSLGKNFTYNLAEPDHLETTGIYRYVQHPSYTGIVLVAAGNLALLCRMDGALSCWIPPQWYETVRTLGWIFFIPAWMPMLGLWIRVREEERMLKAKFGKDWEKWHSRTARFIPWVF
ncbi:hypothetical protein F4776DRAFT_349583 [Hypoxylon sp. NC0597]|nr:hypothetical protein F4776DRAFT_349583 [Hypoxylon sp. NC0597]